MRFSSVFLSLTLALSASSAPTRTRNGSRNARRFHKDDIGDGFPVLTKADWKLGNTNITKILCDSPESDVNGPGTGRTRKEVWDDAEMDKFLPHLDNFLPGREAPFGPYMKSLPITLGDLTNQFNGWVCTREQCDKPEFSSVEKCEESELGAQAWQVMIGLYHIQGFLLSLRDLIMHQGSLIADQAGEYLNRLNPVNFDTGNAGWSIFISSILGGVASLLKKFPATQIAANFVSAAFGLATGSITQIGNENDQKLLDRIVDIAALQSKTASTFNDIAYAVGNMSKKVLEDTPVNRGDKPYSEWEFSAVKLLKGGVFASPVSADITDKINQDLHQAAVIGFAANMWFQLAIAKLTKDLKGTAPCSLKAGDQYPKEFWRLCVGSTAYFFFNASGAPEDASHHFEKLNKPMMKFLEDEDRSVYADLRAVDIINDSSRSEKLFGWNKRWDASDELLGTLLKYAGDRNEGRLSPFNYPFVELDLTDDDPPNALRNKKPNAAEISWTSTKALIPDLMRFMVFQGIREQKDSHGNKFPWPTTENIEWRMYPYRYDGELRKES